MSKYTNQIKHHINAKKYYEHEANEQALIIKEMCQELALSDIEDLSYEELKGLYSSIRNNLTPEFKEIYEEHMRLKKIEKYPALKQATYYPIINTLDIPDEEKVRLDNIANNCYNMIFYENNLNNPNSYAKELGMTLEDLKIFVELKIAKEEIEFLCKRCGDRVLSMEKEILNKHLRYWELKKKETLTPEEEQEFKALWDDEEYCFGIISYECYNCDSWDGEDTVRTEICSIEDYQNAIVELIESSYSFKVEPDRTYDKL